VITEAANKSSLDLEKFSVAMATVAPAANQAGFSIEETTALIGVLSDRGLDASTAGTALRSMFIDLAKTGQTFEQAMAEINASTNKTGTAFKLFGERAAGAAVILAEAGTETKKLTEDLNNAGGSAERVAKEQLDTLSNSVNRLAASWDAFVLSIDQGSGPISQGFRAVIGSATQLLEILAGTNEFNNFKNELEDVTDRARETANDTFLLTRSLRNLANALALKPEGLLEQIGLSTSQATKDVGGLLGEFNKLKEGIALTTDENGKLKELRIAPEDKVLELTEFARKLNFEIAKARAQAISGTLSEEDALKKQQALLILLKEKVTPAIVEANAARVKAAEDGAKASGKEVKAIGEEAAALDALKEKRTATAKEAAAVSGSVVDLTDQISALRKEQGQSTTSEQFQTYQTQIDALTQSVDVLTGKLSQDMVDAANAIPERLDPIISTAPLPDLAGQAIAPTVTDEEALAAVLALEQEYNRLSLENIYAYLAEKKALVDRYGVEAFDAAQARAQAQLDAEYAINAARLDAAGSLGQALTTLAKEGGAAAKIGLALQKASALASVVIDTQREIRAYWANPTWSLFPDGGVAIKTAATVGAITRAAASAAVISAQAIAGFAEGGEVNGDIKRSHGKPIRRSNGDNVLITAKAGEKILNEEQQEELERQHGKDVWKRIGLPGAKYGGRTRDSFLEINGYTTGGTVTSGTALVNVSAPDLTAIESVAEARSFELSVVADIEEIVGVMDRHMRIIEMARG
jgi:hypothetical protein